MPVRLHPRFWKLTALLLLVWVLLSFQLGLRSLWIDEHVTTEMIAGSRGEVITAAALDVHPPLYFLALREWMGAAGASDLALRWPSAAAALLGVALLARLARRWVGPRAVLPAAALLGLNPALIEFSRMARYYALLAALGVLATALLLRAARRNRIWDWAAYALAALALLYVAYPAAILLGAHAVLLLWPATRRRVLARWVAALAVIGGLYLPWLLTAVGPQVERVSGFITADLSRSALGLALGLGASAFTFSVGETLYPWRPEAWLGLAAGASLLWVALLRRGVLAWQMLSVAGVSVLGVAALTTFVAASVPFLNVPARALFALPYYSLAGALGWAALNTRSRGRVLLAAALLIAWGASLFSLYTGQQFLNPIYYTPAREAAALVLQRSAPGDLVISDRDSVFDRYFLPAAGEQGHVYTDEQPGLAARLASTQPARVWLVTIGRDRTQVASQAQAVRETLAGAYTQVDIARLLPIDPLYNRFKAALLRRPSYEYRLTVEIYERTRP